jgi:hypothetical protein
MGNADELYDLVDDTSDDPEFARRREFASWARSRAARRSVTQAPPQGKVSRWFRGEVERSFGRGKACD